MSDITPKAVTNDPELTTGDFSDTSQQPPAPGALKVADEPDLLQDAGGGSTLVENESAATTSIEPSAPAKDEQWREHLEPFWVPLNLRKAQKRDTVAFGFFAILAIVTGAATLLYFQPFGNRLPAPSWVGPAAGIAAVITIVGMLIFGLLSLVDFNKSERSYYASTHDWLASRYGLDLSKHKVKALAKNRTSIGGTTGWKVVKMEGYPKGVQITYIEHDGYRLITTVNNVETQLPQAVKSAH